MNKKIFSRQFLLSDIAILCYLALFKLVLHLVSSGNYGYFRDELYYIACSDHLAFGYVDHPPLSIFILTLARGLLGDSLFAIRFFAAVAGAFVVFITGLMVREFGGGRFAQVLAGIAVIIAGVYLAMMSFFSMNPFDYLFWAMAAYLVILILKNNNPKLWLLFGMVVGLGFLNKYSIALFCVGLIIGLLLTSHRKHLVHKWFWLGGLIAAAIFIPHIIWQVKHGFPTLEFMRNASQYKNLPMAPLRYFLGQIYTMNYVNAPIWLLGLYYYFFNKKEKQYRILGWIFVIVSIIMIASKAKLYYLAPVYTMLFASGAVAIERFIRHYGWNWVKPVFLSLMIISGIMIAPFTMPILPVETLIEYAEVSGMTPSKEEVHELGILPQHLADMFGWENMVATVATVFKSLTPEEQSECVIYARNYGQAGAIDFFGKKYGLPKAISGHNSYYLWGPGDRIGEVTIYLGYDSNVHCNLEDLQQHFEEVEHVATVTCKYCMPYENNLPIFICHGLNFSFQKDWPNFKFYI